MKYSDCKNCVSIFEEIDKMIKTCTGELDDIKVLNSILDRIKYYTYLTVTQKSNDQNLIDDCDMCKNTFAEIQRTINECKDKLVKNKEESPDKFIKEALGDIKAIIENYMNKDKRIKEDRKKNKYEYIQSLNEYDPHRYDGGRRKRSSRRQSKRKSRKNRRKSHRRRRRSSRR
jgi:oligoendopeptidase F